MENGEQIVQIEQIEQNEVQNEVAPWLFYIIHNDGYTYAGVSPDPVKRLRKHNGELAGGAKYTLSKGDGWKHVCLISGFQTKQQALQFEWAFKHVAPISVGGLKQRVKKLYILLNKKQWTSKSISAHLVPLRLEWKMDIVCDNRIVPSYITDILPTIEEGSENIK